MKLYGVVSIDTECDRGKNWRNILPIEYLSVLDIIPNTLQKVFLKYRVKPTYLLSPEVLENNSCVDLLKSLSHVELGSHLHGEFVQPDKKPLGECTGEIQAQYSEELEKLKLLNLTELFEAQIGYKPKSFRAGRWGIGPNTCKILEELGYKVDCSITPYFNWKFPGYFLNYKTAMDTPYFPSANDFMKEGNLRVLQVPVTIYSRYGYWFNENCKYFSTNLYKALIKIPVWRPLWLRPTYSNFDQMKEVIDAHIAHHQSKDKLVLNMMFHTVELLEQENPYDFNQQRIKQFIEDIDRIFEYMQSLKVEFKGLSDLHSIYLKDSDAIRN